MDLHSLKTKEPKRIDKGCGVNVFINTLIVSLSVLILLLVACKLWLH